MGICYITRRGTKTGGGVEQLGVYPTGNNGRPIGDVTVLDNVTILSSYLFKNNSNITNVALPQNLRTIDDNCFQKCISLQNIQIPDKVTKIPNYCFDGCSSINKIKLPKNLTEIGSYAFQDNNSLSIITIPDDIGDLTIKDYAFSGCSLDNETVNKLTTRVVKPVYTYAFNNVTGVTDITTNYTTDYYFNNCTDLEKCTILKPLNSGGFGKQVFNGCTKLHTVVLPDNATIIDSSMFYNNNSLTKVNIPSMVTQIGNDAFRATNVKSLTFPNTLITVGNSGIRGCNKLTSIHLPMSLTELGEYCFYDCNNLKTVTFDENTLITFKQYCFSNCISLTDESVENILNHSNTIYPYLFANCTGLCNLIIKRLWTSMFEGCTGLTSVTITNGSGSTGNKCFYDCTSLQEIYLNTNHTTIGSQLFYNCTSLKTVFLPSSITTVTNNCLTSTSSSYYIFYNCTALEDVQLGQDWNMSLILNVSNNIAVESMVAMFESLKDLTGESKKTLTLGSTNLNKLTDEQKAVATNKNWTLA